MNMASKKQLEKRIADLEEQVKRLENMHANVMLGRSWECPFDVRRGALWETNDGRIGFYRDRQLTAREVQYQTRHPQPKQVDYRCLTNVPKKTVNTDRIPKVSLEELARFVLDGTPIERKTKEEVIYQTSYSPNETSESVETKLGSISVIERTD
jgi:hypothetical protein